MQKSKKSLILVLSISILIPFLNAPTAQAAAPNPTNYYQKEEGEQAQKRRASDIAFSDEVQKEDVDICESVQIGLSSGSYTAGRLNPLRENAVHHFHELLRSAYSRIKEQA